MYVTTLDTSLGSITPSLHISIAYSMYKLSVGRHQISSSSDCLSSSALFLFTSIHHIQSTDGNTKNYRKNYQKAQLQLETKYEMRDVVGELPGIGSAFHHDHYSYYYHTLSSPLLSCPWLAQFAHVMVLTSLSLSHQVWVVPLQSIVVSRGAQGESLLVR